VEAEVSGSARVTESNRGSVPHRSALVTVSVERFRLVMELAGVSNQQLADATGVSKGYVGQVRLGSRTRVSQKFLSRAGDYLGRILGETGRLAVGLVVEDPEDNAGE